MAKGPVSLQTMNVRRADTSCDAVQLRIVPGDRECDGGVQKRAEVVSVVRVFPEIVQVHQHELANGLLEAAVKLIAEPRLDRHGVCAEHILREPTDASRI